MTEAPIKLSNADIMRGFRAVQHDGRATFWGRVAVADITALFLTQGAVAVAPIPAEAKPIIMVASAVVEGLILLAVMAARFRHQFAADSERSGLLLSPDSRYVDVPNEITGPGEDTDGAYVNLGPTPYTFRY